MSRIAGNLKNRFERFYKLMFAHGSVRNGREDAVGEDIGSKNVKAAVPLFLIYLMAFLFGRTLFANTIAPLGPALYVSYRTTLGDLSFLAALAVLAGSASLRQINHLIPAVLSVAAITVLVKPGKKSNYTRISDSLIAGFCVFMARAGTGLLNSPNLFMYLAAFIEGMCTMVCGLAFISAFSSAGSRSEQGLSTNKTNQAFVVLGLFAVGGLQGISVLNLDIGIITAMAGTLVMAYARGPATGSLTGFVCGLVSCLAGGEDPLLIGLLGAAGVLAGIGGWFGRPGAVLGYLSAGLALSFYGESASAISYRLLEQIVSIAAIAFINKNVRESLQRYIPNIDVYPGAGTGLSKPANSPVNEGTPKLVAVSNVFHELGRLFSDSGAAQTKTQNTLPNELAAGLDSVIKHLVDMVCQDCPNRPFCWEEHFAETYEGFAGLARKARLTGRLGLSSTDSPVADKCSRFRELIIHMNHEMDIERLERRLTTIDSETAGCLAFQYKCLGHIISGDKLPGGTSARLANSRPLRLSVKGTTIPASGVDKAGDMWLRYDLDRGKTLLVLADGMGKGDAAAKQSKDAIRLLKSLIDCGLDYTSCISFLNSALYVAWRPDSFVALDCLVIDSQVERAYFYKLGAPPSFIRKADGNVLVVRGSKPPAGAVTDILCYGTSEPVSPGDLIFLVSDGVFRSSPVPARSEHMIMTRLGRLKDNVLENCVRSLVNHCLRYQRQAPDDDITVVGALIEGV